MASVEEPVIKEDNVPTIALDSEIFTDGLWEYTIHNNKATIVGLNQGKSYSDEKPLVIPEQVGVNGYEVASIGPNVFGSYWGPGIVIPSTVTTIQAYAFALCSLITEIIIPANVAFIGEYAFLHCFSLININVEKGNTNYEDIDGVLFDKAQKAVHSYPYARKDSHYSIPEGIRVIGEAAFLGASFESISIPDSVMEVNTDAFASCRNLKEVDLPQNVTNIPLAAFAGCKELQNITFPKDLIHIGEGAFSSCESLVSIAIPSGATTIEAQAFSGCTNLQSIDIPNSITSIGEGAFSSCESLTGIAIPSGIITIEAWVFSGCTNLQSIDIPNGVTSIGDQAFDDCSRWEHACSASYRDFFFLCRYANSTKSKVARFRETHPALENRDCKNA